jgi:hypothetical protein
MFYDENIKHHSHSFDVLPTSTNQPLAITILLFASMCLFQFLHKWGHGGIATQCLAYFP